jgi:hypothetical protein
MEHAAELPRTRRRRPRPRWWWELLALTVFMAGAVVYGLHAVMTRDRVTDVALNAILTTANIAWIVVNVKLLTHTVDYEDGDPRPPLETIPGAQAWFAVALITWLVGISFAAGLLIVTIAGFFV